MLVEVKLIRDCKSNQHVIHTYNILGLLYYKYYRSRCVFELQQLWTVLLVAVRKNPIHRLPRCELNDLYFLFLSPRSQNIFLTYFHTADHGAPRYKKQLMFKVSSFARIEHRLASDLNFLFIQILEIQHRGILQHSIVYKTSFILQNNGR